MTADLHHVTHEYLKAIRADMKRMLEKQDNPEKLLLQVPLSTATVVHEQSFLTQRIAELDARLERVENRLELVGPSQDQS